MAEPRVVSVEIHGLRYPIRSALEPSYVAELATYVDAKMHAAADETATGDSVKIAVLAALNIADEFFRSREHDHSSTDEVARRVEDIEALIDRAISLAQAAGSPPGPPEVGESPVLLP
jgi:cell division protein ZapA